MDHIATLKKTLRSTSSASEITNDDAREIYNNLTQAAARAAALEAEVAGLKEENATAWAANRALINHAERTTAALATARADALEEAARVAEGFAKRCLRDSPETEIAAAIRALALTPPASTQPLTDQGSDHKPLVDLHADDDASNQPRYHQGDAD